MLNILQKFAKCQKLNKKEQKSREKNSKLTQLWKISTRSAAAEPTFSISGRDYLN